MRRIATMMLAGLIAIPLVGSCSEGDGGAGETWEPCAEGQEPISHATGETDVVLRIGLSGGLPPPVPMPEGLPTLTLFGDGRLVAVDGAADRLVPVLVERRLTEEQMQEVLHLAEGACLFERDAFLELPETYDVPSIRFAANAEGASHETSAVGLGWSEMDANVPAEQEDQRQALLDVQAKVLELAGSETTAVPTDRLGVFVAEAGGPPTDETWPVVGWPLEQPLAAFGDEAGAPGGGARCGIVAGAEADALLAAVEDLPSGRQPSWKDAGTWYQVYLRPMLPDETECSALLS